MCSSTVTAIFNRMLSGRLSVRPPVINSAEFVINLCNIVRCRIFCLPVCYPEIQRFVYPELYFCLLFFVGITFRLSHSRRNRG